MCACARACGACARRAGVGEREKRACGSKCGVLEGLGPVSDFDKVILIGHDRLPELTFAAFHCGR